MSEDREPGTAETTDERLPHRRAADGKPSRITGERYRIGEPIGRGGMGEVVAAFDEQIGRDVAIKRIRTADPGERTVKRFLREAQIQGRLEHPAIPPVHELGRDLDGLPYFAMKKLAGTNLASILRSEQRDAKYSRQRLLRAFTDICLALEFAHVNGIVHRDIKPDNIMLGEFGEVYVIDWGVAKLLDEAGDFEDIRADQLQTRVGAAVGTPGFMAPEQERGDSNIDARADVYALGIVLREILRADPDAPPELAALATRATAEDRSNRIQTARELGEAVQHYLDGDRDLALRRELARGHLAAGRSAFQAGKDPEHQRTAMREAGRALALDPQLHEAGDLVNRIFVEPPSKLPSEVEAALEEDSVQRGRALSRGAFFALLVVALFAATLFATGAVTYGLILSAFAVATAVLQAITMTRQVPPIVRAIAYTAIVAVVARLYSPLLVALPCAICVSMAFGINPRMKGASSTMAIFSMLSLGILGPLIGELAGWWSTTMHASQPGGIRFVAPGLASPYLDDNNVLFAAAATFIVVALGAVAMLTHITRREDQRLRRTVHLQAWQIRQLVPDPHT